MSDGASTGWLQTMISSSTEHGDRIAAMFDFIFSEEGMFLNHYGIEGEDYTVDDSGIVIPTEEGKIRLENDYANNIALWAVTCNAFQYAKNPAPEEGTNDYIYTQARAALAKSGKAYVYDFGAFDWVAIKQIFEPSSDLGINLSQIDNYLESQKAKIVSATTDEQFDYEYQNMLNQLAKYNADEIDAAYDEYFKQVCEEKNITVEWVNADLY